MGTDQFNGLSDDAVLDRAVGALKQAATAEPGSDAHALIWARFDAAMLELDRRVVRRLIEALRAGQAR